MSLGTDLPLAHSLCLNECHLWDQGPALPPFPAVVIPFQPHSPQTLSSEATLFPPANAVPAGKLPHSLPPSFLPPSRADYPYLLAEPVRDMVTWCTGAAHMPWGPQPMQQPDAGFNPSIPPPARQTQHEAYAHLLAPARPASPAQPEASSPSAFMLTSHASRSEASPHASWLHHLPLLLHTSHDLLACSRLAVPCNI